MHLAVSLLGFAPPARPWHGDYCAALLPHLLAHPAVTRATLLVTPFGARQWQHLASERVQLKLVEGLDERKRRRFFAERYLLPDILTELAPDAVFAPLGGALLHPRPAGSEVHPVRYVYRLPSLGYLLEPERYSMLEQLFYGKTLPVSCRSADSVVVDHSALADAVAERGIASREKTSVVEQGLNQIRSTATEGGGHRPSGPYILCLGGDDDHQLPRLLSGLLEHARLPRGWADATFVCLSRQAGQVSGPRLLAIEDAPEDVYAALLQGASAALQLSPGDDNLPALRHALGAGLPTLAADTPAARAVTGKAALYVTPYELTETASALAVLLGDEALRGELSAAARQRSTTSTWESAAARIVELMQHEH